MLSQACWRRKADAYRNSRPFLGEKMRVGIITSGIREREKLMKVVADFSLKCEVTLSE